MIAYWVLFSIWAAGALQFRRQNFGRIQPLLYVAAAVSTALMIGLRYNVGGDWLSYIEMYDDIFFMSLGSAVYRTDPGYSLMNWLAAQFGVGMWFVNLSCGIVFMAGLGRLASRQPNPWLAVLVAVPYLVIVVAMGYTRQAAAIGIICWAIADASSEKIVRIIVLISLAALFHKTAILFLPIILAPMIVRSPMFAAFGVFVFVVLFNLFLGESADRLITNYVNSDYDSQGAAIRIAMNVLAACCFLYIRNRVEIDKYKKDLWTICSLVSIISVAAFVSVNASSGVDRMALFLIPLQIVAFSHFPYAIVDYKKANPTAMITVIIYSFAVQFVWLNFATNSNSWVPYQLTIFAENW